MPPPAPTENALYVPLVADMGLHSQPHTPFFPHHSPQRLDVYDVHLSPTSLSRPFFVPRD
jgi:hypothetical protein